MDRKTPDDFGFSVEDVVQESKIILVGKDEEGNPLEMVVATNRRVLPVPYTEEP